MQAVDLFDRLTVETAGASRSRRASRPATDDRTWSLRRGPLLRRGRGCRCGGADLLDSAFPVAAGLAADRSDAGRQLVGSQALGAPLAPREARGAGGEARDGVPFFPGARAGLGKSRGEVPVVAGRG